MRSLSSFRVLAMSAAAGAGLLGWVAYWSVSTSLVSGEGHVPVALAAPSVFSHSIEPVAATATASGDAATPVLSRAAGVSVQLVEAVRLAQPFSAKTEEPLDIEAALKASFESYDTRLTQQTTMPAWWGNRNIQADISSVDPLASVTAIRCAETLCGVDVTYQEIPEPLVLEEKLMDQPSLQGGALIRRFSDDPRRMRIYIHAAEMESRPRNKSPRPS